MKVEIQQLSDDPSCSLLEVYTDGLRPVCIIDENDFAELLTDKQIDKMIKGTFKFFVTKQALFDKCKRWTETNM